MAAINEAYRVLSDPGRRALYDRQVSSGTGSAATSTRSSAASTGARRGGTATAGSAATAAAATWDAAPARMPWRFMAAMAGLGIAVVLVGAAFVEPPGPEVPDGLLGPGSCVSLQQNNAVREIACSESADLVVDRLVPFDQRCPAGTAGFPDGQGMGLACVIQPGTGSGAGTP
jgi:molecular chaperone DnaJ